MRSTILYFIYIVVSGRADDMIITPPEVYIDLSLKNHDSIYVYCQNADRPQWYRGQEMMNMKSPEECRKMSNTQDYFCHDKFHIANPSARHAGEYTCRDMAHKNRFKTVYVQTFLEQVKSDDVHAVEGNDVTLSCTNELFLQPPLKYKWQKSGQIGNLPNEDTHVNYTIRNVAVEDSGVYTCIIRKSFWMKVTKTVFLSVRAGADDMIVTPKDVYINLSLKNHDSIYVYCQNADRPQWYRGDEKMDTKSPEECRKMSNTQDYFCHDKFHIANPSARHAGEYTCRDMAHKNRFKTVYVQTFLEQVKSDVVHVVEGNDVTLSCTNELFLRPPLKYKWQKSGQIGNLPNEDTHVNFAIRNATVEDRGVYTCILRKSFWMKVTKTVFLSVKDNKMKSVHNCLKTYIYNKQVCSNRRMSPFKQILSNLTQRCSQAIDPPTVYIATTQGNCMGAVILSQVAAVSHCSPEQILSQAKSWATNNSRSDIEPEISTETCQPAYYKKSNICSDLTHCDRIAQRVQKTWDRCRLLLAPSLTDTHEMSFVAIRRSR